MVVMLKANAFLPDSNTGALARELKKWDMGGGGRGGGDEGIPLIDVGKMVSGGDGDGDGDGDYDDDEL